MKFILILAVFLLSACETVVPYYELGIGHTLDSGDYTARIGAPKDQSIHYIDLEERCAAGMIALGLEFEHDLSLELNHLSCFNHTPEIAVNSIMFKKRGYFK